MDKASDFAAETRTPVCQNKLQDLVELLLRQITLARQGRIEQVETLAAKGDEIVRQIKDDSTLQMPQSEHLKQHAKELYRKLFITLADKRFKTTQEIEDIRRGRKTIRIYRQGL